MDELSLTRFKCCRGCGCWKPRTTTFFYTEKRVRDGFYARCKSCVELARFGYQERWYSKNRDYAIQYGHSYRSANRDSIRALARKNALNNPERRANAVRQRKARKVIAGASHTIADEEQMYRDQNGLCAYCEWPLNGNYHADHMIPLIRGGSNGWDNIALACPTCNCSKKEKTPEEYWRYVCLTQNG